MARPDAEAASRADSEGDMAARAVRALAAAALLAALLAVPAAAQAPAETEPEAVTIYFFWGDGCPHCASLHPYLEELASQPGVELEEFEVWYEEANRELFQRVAEAHGVDAGGVPAVFIGGGAWIGDSPANRSGIAAVVDECTTRACPDVAGAIVGGREPPSVPEEERPETGGTVITLPFLGSHDVGADSLVWATALIAFVDGFNPCSLWVLTVLIAMLLRTGSRGRLSVVGGTYLVTVAAVYGLFLIGLFGALTVVEYQWWIRATVVAFALAFAAINVKDYVWFGRGVSLTIPDRLKPRIAHSAHAVAFEDRKLPVVVGATAALAAGVSLLELPCTVGFPVVWTNLLAERGVANAEYAFLLAVYLLVFLVDEIAILAVAIAAMRLGRVEERHGRVLKLAGGMLMLVLAGVMLVDPGLLENVTGALLALVVAAGLTVAAIAVHGAVSRRRATGKGPPAVRGPAHRAR
jgi:cytochrome c biogenesis protein CcdA/thiol-disulfide isomerase/thioredoxin